MKPKILPSSTRKPYLSMNAQDYFNLACNWSDDTFLTQQTAARRWRTACLYLSLPLHLILLGFVLWLLPNRQFIPLLVHHYQKGIVVVEPIDHAALTINQAQTESDLARYVLKRESYYPETYQQQYTLVHLLSNDHVSAQYRVEQNARNLKSPIHTLGRRGYRIVHIQQVILLNHMKEAAQSSNTHQGSHRLAQVIFTTEDHSPTGVTQPQLHSAFLSWEYRKMPRHSYASWHNWDGLTVTFYRIETTSHT